MEWTEANERQRQGGGVLSPLLFNIVMDDTMKEAERTTSKVYVHLECWSSWKTHTSLIKKSFRRILQLTSLCMSVDSARS